MSDLIGPSDPRLRQPCVDFDFDDPGLDARGLASSLVETMSACAGLGLSACQVGVMRRAFAIWSAPPMVMFNPRVVAFSEEQVLLDEGCLSFPGLTLLVKRPKSVRVRYQQVNGEVVTRRFEGLTARVIQHEVDHLDGKLFFSRVSRPKLDAALRRARKLGRNYTFNELVGKH